MARGTIVNSVRVQTVRLLKRTNELKKKNSDHDTRKPLHSAFHGLEHLVPTQL